MTQKMTNKERIAAGLPPIGRPPEVKSGPRPVNWVLVSYSKEKTIVCHANADSTPNERGTFSKEDAVKIFLDQVGVEPDEIHGPFYYQVGALKSKGKEDIVNIDILNCKFTDTVTCTYNDWEGFALRIEGHPEIVYFNAQKLIDCTITKKTIPQPCVLKTSAIKIK